MKKLLASILMGAMVFAIALTPLFVGTTRLAQANTPTFGTGRPENPTQPLDAPGASRGSGTKEGVNGSIDAILKDTTDSITSGNNGASNAKFTAAVTSESVVTALIICPVFSRTNCSEGGIDQLGVAKNVFQALYTPPANTRTYVADLMQGVGVNIAQPAYAQGVGFSSLDPVLDTWKVFRNLAYLFYVVLFLVIGFMIMFRQKISSQAVVTAQQALPKVIVSLLAVTFSYAIAGLLIDMMFLMMYLLINLFPNQVFGNTGVSMRAIAMDKNIFEIAFYILFGPVGGFGGAQGATAEIIDSLFQGIGGWLSDIIGWIGGLTFAAVFSLAILFGVFRLFFKLIETYISIIIAIVLSPIALMLGALPGNNAFQSWIKTLIANLAVFPAIMIVLAIAMMLIGNSSTSRGNNIVSSTTPLERVSGGFAPPYLPAQDSAGAISMILGLAVVLILPDIVTQVKSSIGGKGGIFEQFANNFTSALKKGWEGGQLIPGFGPSDISKWPMGGLTGQNMAKKGAVIGAGIGGGLVGGVLAAPGALARHIPVAGGVFSGNVAAGANRGGRRAARNVAKWVGEKDLFAAKDEKK